MRGVIIRKIKLVHEDGRRKLLEILNGEIDIKSIKIIEIKEGGQILGNHYHTYPEAMYIMKGKAHYWLKHVLTGETEEMDLEEGDIMIKTGFITHTGKFSEGSIIIDFAAETWIDESYNHVRDKIV